MTLADWKPGLFGWHKDPFAEMERLRREMDRIFNSIIAAGEISPSAGVFPALNISEDADNLYARAELPGVSPEDIEITAEGNSLIIKGERKITPEAENLCYHRREREAGEFKRIISLPTQIDPTKVTALCRDGVLTVILPKAPEAKPRQIEVKSG